MLFNSFGFLAFFALTAGISYRLPQRHRWIWLLATSLFFYATFGLGYVALLAGTTVVSYAAGLAIGGARTQRTKRTALIAGIVIVLGALFVVKYYDFFRRSTEAVLAWARMGAGSGMPRLEIAVAAGLSFYTFSCIGYLADVYRGQLQPERHLGRFALYTSFFPKLLAGPLERARPFFEQIDRPVAFRAANVASGLQLMLWGLFKKVVIADRLAGFVDTAYQLPELTSPADLLLATYFFAFQLYCDFSGYSDIAIGAARVLGVDLVVNFRRPYFSTSIPEFWAKRWHLSLSAWFRDYLYFPLGGSRTSRVRQYLNVMTVFLVSGLWHGANWTFVIWGGLNGLYQILSLATAAGRARLVPTAEHPSLLLTLFRRVLTFHLVLVSWVFFRASSIPDAVAVLTRVTGSLPRLPALLRARFASGEVLLSTALILVLLAVEAFEERGPIWERLDTRPLYVRWAVYYALLIALAVLGVWDLQQFVYMQF